MDLLHADHTGLQGHTDIQFKCNILNRAPTTHTHNAQTHSQHTLKADKIQQNVYYNESSSSPNPSRAVDHNGPRLLAFSPQHTMTQVYILQEPQHGPRIMGHTMVWPCLEVEMEDMPPSF